MRNTDPCKNRAVVITSSNDVFGSVSIRYEAKLFPECSTIGELKTAAKKFGRFVDGRDKIRIS